MSWAVERQYGPDDIYVWKFAKFSEAWQMFKACRTSGCTVVRLRLCFRFSFPFWSWRNGST